MMRICIRPALTLILPLSLILLLPIPALAAPVGEHAGEFLVDGPLDAQPASGPANPDVVIDESGRSIWVWDGTPAGTRREVFLRIIPADGDPPTDPVQVNTFTADNQNYPRVAAGSDGSFLVAWLSKERPDPESNPRYVIRSQAFDANANPVGGTQSSPRVASYGTGGFFVVWESNASAGDDLSLPAIEGRILTGSDQFAGPEFQLNKWTPQKQQFPGISGKNGRVAVGWDSATNAESSASVIYAQFWSICGIFCDGFE